MVVVMGISLADGAHVRVAVVEGGLLDGDDVAGAVGEGGERPCGGVASQAFLGGAHGHQGLRDGEQLIVVGLGGVGQQEPAVGVDVLEVHGCSRLAEGSAGGEDQDVEDADLLGFVDDGRRHQPIEQLPLGAPGAQGLLEFPGEPRGGVGEDEGALDPGGVVVEADGPALGGDGLGRQEFGEHGAPSELDGVDEDRGVLGVAVLVALAGHEVVPDHVVVVDPGLADELPPGVSEVLVGLGVGHEPAVLDAGVHGAPLDPVPVGAALLGPDGLAPFPIGWFFALAHPLL